MTDHTFTDPLERAFQKLEQAVADRTLSSADPEALSALQGQNDMLVRENTALKASLAEMKSRESELRQRLDAAIAKVDDALREG